jgi:hypothetical protein
MCFLRNFVFLFACTSSGDLIVAINRFLCHFLCSGAADVFLEARSAGALFCGLAAV